MPQVRVWNDNRYPYSETFKGQKIEIPPKGFIKMDYEEAIEFKGTYCPIHRDGDGQPLPTSYKMIRVETPSEAVVSDEDLDLVCHADGSVAANKQELAKKLKQHEHLAVKDEEAEKATKRGPGRPKKEAN